MWYSLKFAIFILVFLLPGSGLAYSELAEPPSFESMLVSEPVVVVASMTGETSKSSKKFAAVDKDNPAYTEVYVHYGFELRETLKGKLSKKFEIRQIADAKGQVQFESGREVLMVLSPDLGKDAEGNRRSGYLVSFAAHYPVINDSITVSSAGDVETWTLQMIRERLASAAQATERRYQANAETPEAASVPVISGELERSPAEPELPAAKTDRDHGLATYEQLGKSRARNADSPAGVLATNSDPKPESKPETNSIQIPAWFWLFGIVALLLVVWLVRR